MTEPIGTYTFLPWVRLGLANHIGPATATRPAIDVKLNVEGNAKAGAPPAPVEVARTVELYGPGDIVGIDTAQVSRVEPPHWVTNFEPNYLPCIEFYDEDFPWRYTPSGATGRRLLPWLALVVLEEEVEFAEGRSVAGKPLSYIDVTADFSKVFPNAADAWAWAHAHFNAEFSANVVETDATKAAQAAQQVMSTAPDTACSRILCPRKLKPTTGYHAFLIPAFESGRLAGLGREPEKLFADPANALNATSSAWGAYGVPANRPEATSFPFYHRWFFRTSENGDFESLVRILKPRPVDSRVGHRDIDVSDPAPNITGIDEFGGVLRMGGALKAPFDTLPKKDKDELTKFDQWATPYPQPFQEQVAAFVDLADSYQQMGPAAAHADPKLDGAADDPDAPDDGVPHPDPNPLITPPLYGRWHALTERLLTNRDGTEAPNSTNWVHDLNLDPRWRAAAGFGTKVVQDEQEKLMEGAWKQIGDVLEANRRIRQAQLAKHAGMHLHDVHIRGAAEVSPARVLLLTAPLTARIVSDGVTVRHRQLQSPMHTTLTSSAMRRVMRPGGPLAKRLDLTDPIAAADVVEQANDGTISAAPPREPPALVTPDDLAHAAALTGVQAVLARIGSWLKQHAVLAILLVLLVLALILVASGFSVAGFVLAMLLAVGAAVVWWLARRAAAREDEADRLGEDAMTPATVDTLPGAANFTLVPDVDPRTPPSFTPVRPGQQDNAEAKRFKDGLRDEFRLIDQSRTAGTVPATTQLPLPAVATAIVAGTRPEMTVPRWIWSAVAIPGRIRDQMGEDFVEVMAYPEFDIPMYEPLSKDKEGFVPNIHLVEPNSVTLLETNQRFIESYLVGLNHEFARELLWREYPTDQRGSYFRQFWDVRKKLAQAGNTAAAREQLKDVKPLHRWPRANDLGDNDNREVGANPEEELVLVVRGELLKKYPNTVVSAQPAKWQPKSDGTPDKTKERVLDETVTPIFPLYEARVEPDIYFFGFDLTAKVARGDDTVDTKPGWFFRIEEVPGDARFGFDISRDSGAINVWNDLAWPDVAPGVADGGLLKASAIPPRTLVEPTQAAGLGEKIQQWKFDKFVPLDAQLSAAELAYIALQTPVIMAVHASELLPDQENTP
ncbi:MAG: hypothetical protein QOI28_1997 [Mycobacterium sp.]|nr:hypothetical protein [Mycobacterium sp.]